MNEHDALPHQDEVIQDSTLSVTSDVAEPARASLYRSGDVAVGDFLYVKKQHHFDLICSNAKLGEVVRRPQQPHMFECEILAEGQRERFVHMFQKVVKDNEDDYNGHLVIVYPTDERHFWELVTDVITKRILFINRKNRLRPLRLPKAINLGAEL